MRRRIELIACSVLVVITAGLLWQPALAQTAVRIYGTLSGTLTGVQTPQAILATSDGYLGVSIQGGTIPGSVFNCTQNGIATTSTDCFTAINTTDATGAATVQMSPRYRMRGEAWDTNDSVSRTTDFWIEGLPVSGTSPTANWRLQYSLDGAAAATPLLVTSAGAVFPLGNVELAAANTFKWSARNVIGSAANGTNEVTNAAGTLGIQFNVGSAAPTVVTGFGTSPSVVSGARNGIGSLNVGTGGTATQGVLTFGTPAWTNAPFCTAWVETGTAGDVRAHGITTSTTQMTITAASAWAASSIVAWKCEGRI